MCKIYEVVAGLNIIGILVCLYFTTCMTTLLLKLIGVGLCFIGVAGLACTFSAMLKAHNRAERVEVIRERKKA